MESFGRALRLMALCGGIVLVALMGYTVLDVILRYGFNRPFSGSLETHLAGASGVLSPRTR